jgi:hypothetical protein
MNSHCSIIYMNLLLFCAIHYPIYRVCNSHSGIYEEYCILRYNIVSPVECESTFRRNTPPPFSSLKSKPNKKKQGSACRLLHVGFSLCLLSTMKMEATFFSETSDNIYVLHVVISQKIPLFIMP